MTLTLDNTYTDRYKRRWQRTFWVCALASAALDVLFTIMDQPEFFLDLFTDNGTAWFFFLVRNGLTGVIIGSILNGFVAIPGRPTVSTDVASGTTTAAAVLAAEAEGARKAAEAEKASRSAESAKARKAVEVEEARKVARAAKARKAAELVTARRAAFDAYAAKVAEAAEAAKVADAATCPAGWYPDGSSGGGLRWWDGQVWTSHTHPGG